MRDRVVHVIDHPLVQHKLTLMRDRHTGPPAFRRLLREIAMLMAGEITRDLPSSAVTIETPLETTPSPLLETRGIVFVVVLRAGQGLLDGLLELVPDARVGHVGLFRDPATLQAVEYLARLPPDMAGCDALVLDPMLATGNSAAAAVDHVKRTLPRSIRFVSLVAAPEGLAAFHDRHPDVPVFTAAIDRCLDDHGYILPGLGDAGDRLFGTA